MAFASNKRAYGICDITGFRYRLKDMKKTWDGLLVGPDQWSPKHPQIQRKPTPIDPQALKDARPDPSSDGNDNNFFIVYTNVGDGKLGTSLQTFGLTCSVGTVEVTTS
jgi:hypothetical protein|tara:strand:+ start:36 stop:359 length:324 start_codon:yes stop_codon:yes gene_type:complete